MTGPKILVLDIERLPGKFVRNTRGLEVSGEFWDLSQHKSLIGRIHADDVTQWPRTICIAWRFIGRKRVEFASEWDDGAEEMFRRIRNEVHAADVVVGHNVGSFDMRHLKTGWRDFGIAPPSPYKVVDTLRIARREFGDESKTLDALTKRLGISSKTDRYSVDVAKAACAGDQAAQKKLRAYNVGDIEASEALYLALNPWDSQAVHLGLYEKGERDRCRCGSTDLKKQGKAYTSLGVYQQYRCAACGRWSRGKRALETVGAR